MLKAILDLLTRRPDLLVEHAAAYVELIKVDARRARSLWLRRFISAALTTILAMSAVIVSAITATLCKAGVMPWSLDSFGFAVAMVAITLAAGVWAWMCFRTSVPAYVGAQLRSDASGLQSLWSAR